MADFAGKEATFKCKLKGINQYELPELTDELVKELTSYETVADFTAYVKEQLEKSAEAQAKADFENDVMNALVAKILRPTLTDLKPLDFIEVSGFGKFCIPLFIPLLCHFRCPILLASRVIGP